MKLSIPSFLRAWCGKLSRVFAKRSNENALNQADQQPPAVFERNRYDPADLIDQLSKQNSVLVAGRREYELDAEPCEIGIDLPDRDGIPAPEAFDFLSDVLRHINDLDNLVQSSCEKECARAKLHSDNYRLGIGWISIDDEYLANQTVTLTYYGLKVNTSWDAKFKREPDGSWHATNF